MYFQNRLLKTKNKTKNKKNKMKYSQQTMCQNAHSCESMIPLRTNKRVVRRRVFPSFENMMPITLKKNTLQRNIEKEETKKLKPKSNQSEQTNYPEQKTYMAKMCVLAHESTQRQINKLNAPGSTTDLILKSIFYGDETIHALNIRYIRIVVEKSMKKDDDVFKKINTDTFRQFLFKSVPEFKELTQKNDVCFILDKVSHIFHEKRSKNLFFEHIVRCIQCFEDYNNMIILIKCLNLSGLSSENSIQILEHQTMFFDKLFAHATHPECNIDFKIHFCHLLKMMLELDSYIISQKKEQITNDLKKWVHCSDAILCNRKLHGNTKEHKSNSRLIKLVLTVFLALCEKNKVAEDDDFICRIDIMTEFKQFFKDDCGSRERLMEYTKLLFQSNKNQLFNKIKDTKIMDRILSWKQIFPASITLLFGQNKHLFPQVDSSIGLEMFKYITIKNNRLCFF